MMRIRSSSGFALIAVLWTVAALGIIVGGVVSAQRQEVRLITASRQAVEGRAIGQAVTYILAKDILAGNQKLQYTRQYPVAYMGRLVQVEVMALDGLVDINKTPKPLLIQMLMTLGELPPQEAEALAQKWVDQRETARFTGGWHTPAELMGVPTMQYDIFARIAPYLTAHSDMGSGLVDPLFAPSALLKVLSKGNAAIAAEFSDARQKGVIGLDTTRLEQAFIGVGGRKKVRFTANVSFDAESFVSTITDLDMGSTPGQPWRVLQTSWSNQRRVSP